MLKAQGSGLKGTDRTKAEAGSKEKKSVETEGGFKGSDASRREARLQKEKQTRRQQKKDARRQQNQKKLLPMLGRLTTNTRNGISRSNAAPSGGYFATQTDHPGRPKSAFRSGQHDGHCMDVLVGRERG